MFKNITEALNNYFLNGKKDNMSIIMRFMNSKELEITKPQLNQIYIKKKFMIKI